MNEKTSYSEGDAVTFTIGPLGALRDVGDSKFAVEKDGAGAEVPVTLNAGDAGEYVGPHPSLGDRWHVVGVEVGRKSYVVPVHDQQFRHRLPEDENAD